MNRQLEELLSRKDAPLFSIVSRKGIQEYLASDMTWPWYGQLMRRPQVIAWLLQTDFWLRRYQVELLF